MFSSIVVATLYQDFDLNLLYLTRNSSDHPPKLKVQDENAVDDEETSQSKDGSMDDLRKAFQNADVDFRGVSRKATLKRRVTILSRDPKRNDLLLKKRALQRQIKVRYIMPLLFLSCMDITVILSSQYNLLMASTNGYLINIYQCGLLINDREYSCKVVFVKISSDLSIINTGCEMCMTTRLIQN